jgi:guanine deaminase
MSATAYLGQVYTPVGCGGHAQFSDGALLVDDRGRIVALGERAPMNLNGHRIVDLRPSLLIPGLVDCHQHLTHYEWAQMVPDLFRWLSSIYAIEARFTDVVHARVIAKAFFGELIRNGTTTCCVHGPYFQAATHVAFEEAAASGMRVLMGMNMGDVDLPSSLAAKPRQSLRSADELHAAWAGRAEGLLDYVYTVRPAYCASERLLRGVGDRIRSGDRRLQSHLAESAEGRARIEALFPQARNETSVYESFGLLTARTMMAHGVYATEGEIQLLAEKSVAVAHCPRANLLSGGRQMRLSAFHAAGIGVGLGSDLGAGKGLSLFKTMEDALKVTPELSIHDVFRLATLDGATALSLEETTGSLEVGKEADFLVLSPKAEAVEGDPVIEDILSSLVFRGDDRDIGQVYVKGKCIAAAAR